MKYHYPKTQNCSCGGKMRQGSRPALLGAFFFALLALLGIMMLDLLTVTLAGLLFTVSVITCLKAPKKMLYVCPVCRKKKMAYRIDPVID